jgi:hypothetical protein
MTAKKKAKSKRLIVAPEWRLIPGRPMRVQFLECFSEPTTVGKTNKPLARARCRALDGGEVGVLMAPQRVRELLEHNFNGRTYVGRSFEITRNEKRPGERNHSYSIFLVE